MTPVQTRSSAPATELTPGVVLVLQAARDYPCVSLLMTTRPGPRLDATAASSLRALAGQARRRLTAENLGEARSGLMERLDDLVEETVAGPVERAVALYVGGSHTRRLNLPVEVIDRCVVDPTFATRDLVRALHRTPRHVVLVLSGREARLFEGAGTELAPAPARAFPRHRQPDQSDRAFLRDIDSALGAYLRLHPAPLVLMGAEPTLSAFRNTSHNTLRLAAAVKGNYLNAPLPEIAELTRPALETYLHSRQQEALRLLEQRSSQDRAVFGLAAAWLAARWERPEMLAVETGYFQPVRISADGDTLEAADDPEHPDVTDDAVDELIEAVLRRGGWVALLDDGGVPDGSRVALTVHR